jgi:hypothetical protein
MMKPDSRRLRRPQFPDLLEMQRPMAWCDRLVIAPSFANQRIELACLAVRVDRPSVYVTTSSPESM